ncbi:MAG: FAD-dependent oxidoreductase, partial [Hansschlegelia sp.]
FDGEAWRLSTSTCEVRAKAVINCAGLYGDRIERLLLGDASFEIKPRKGQFVVFDKAAARLVRSIVLPVPNERTKGVVLCRTAFGNVLVGPTAEEQEDRTRATVEEATLKGLVARAVEMVPALAEIDVTAVYAGLRPASEEKGYRIRVEADRRWISLGGVRSTGLTASLGLAALAYRLYGEIGIAHGPAARPVWPRVPNIAEHLPRDWEQPGHGEIVCHCELVTRREIDAALDGPVPPGDFGGLKRRTRCGMGRCQGFNCNARLASLTAGRFTAPLAKSEAA